MNLEYLTEKEAEDLLSFEPATPMMRRERQSPFDEHEYLFYADELEDSVDGDWYGAFYEFESD